MATTTVSIGSRTNTVDTQTPASNVGGTGPSYTVTFGTTPTGIAVGHIGTVDAYSWDEESSSVFVYVVTAISGDNITVKYLKDTESRGHASPYGLYSDGGSSGSPVQQVMVFKRSGITTAQASASAPSYTVTFGDAGPPADLHVGDLGSGSDQSSGSDYTYVVTGIDLSNKTVTMQYVHDDGDNGTTSPHGLVGEDGNQLIIDFNRAFSTITLFEEMIDDSSPNYWGSSDDVVGELHADSTFTDNDINFNSKQSLSSVTLSVYSDDRHDGTAESGALIKPTSKGTHSHGLIQVQIDDMTIEWLDISLASVPDTSGGTNSQNQGIRIVGNNIDNLIIRNNLIHDCSGNKGSAGPSGIAASTDGGLGNTWSFLNNIIYGMTETADDSATGIVCRKYRGTFYIYNNTIYKITGHGGSKDAIGIRVGYYTNMTYLYIKNNIVAGLSASDDEYAYDIQSNVSNKSVGYNLSDDTSESSRNAQNMGRSYNTTVNPGALVGKTLSEIDFNENDITGSVDLHIGTSSACLEAGVDLGTTNGVNIDIDGLDRDATGVTWDIGADQKSEAASTGSPAFLMFVD
ncbi:MAG: hypothetical protein CL833_12740 [Crocinitomicaceae bacterium]|nr:hypothetical protein [Crocinitomicaceae bacterium]